MNVDNVFNKVRLRNIKRAKLHQRQAELKLAQKNNEETIEIEKDINKLEKEIDRLF